MMRLRKFRSAPMFGGLMVGSLVLGRIEPSWAETPNGPPSAAVAPASSTSPPAQRSSADAPSDVPNKAAAPSPPGASGSSPAASQPGTARASAPSQAAPPPSPAPQGATPVRRDPKGITGIAPYMEALLRGDAAYLALDFGAAEREYRAAVELAPQEARAHLRLAAVEQAQGKFDEARLAAEAAARFAGPDAKLRSDARRFIALAAERLAASDPTGLERARDEWKAFALEEAKVPRKPAAPEDIAEKHVARIEARLQLLEQSALVRARIDKGLEPTAKP